MSSSTLLILKVWSDMSKGNIVIKKRLAEAQSLQKQIREAELELARIKAKHPTDNVSLLLFAR